MFTLWHISRKSFSFKLSTSSPTCAPMWDDCGDIFGGEEGGWGGEAVWQLCGEVRPLDRHLWNLTRWLSGDSNMTTTKHAQIYMLWIFTCAKCCSLSFSFMIMWNEPVDFLCFVLVCFLSWFLIGDIFVIWKDSTVLYGKWQNNQIFHDQSNFFILSTDSFCYSLWWS